MYVFYVHEMGYENIKYMCEMVVGKYKFYNSIQIIWLLMYGQMFEEKGEFRRVTSLRNS